MIQRSLIGGGDFNTNLFVFLNKSTIFDLPLRCMKTLYSLLFLLSTFSFLWGQRPYQTLTINKEDEFQLKNHLYHLEDTVGQIDILKAIDLQKKGRFHESFSHTHRQDFGYNKSFHWLFFELNATQKANLMLEIEYANIDHIELYEVKENGQIRSLGLSGDRYKYAQRPFMNNNYVFPIRLKTNEKAKYFLYLDQRNAILSFFIRLWERPTFLQTDRKEYFAWGGFIGGICIIWLINLVMLLITKDWIYFWYSMYGHCMTMHLFSDAGMGFQYLWPNAPIINQYDPVYLYIWAAIIVQITFMQYFIHQTSRNSRIFWWNNAFKILLTIGLTTAIGIHFFEVEGKEAYMYKIVSKATSYFVLILVVLTAISLYERWHEKEKMVRYYGYALIIQLWGYVAVAFINFCQSQGWPLPFDVETYVVIGITVLFDTVFFSYGLAHRYNNFQRRNKTLELSLLQAQQMSQQRIIEALEYEQRRLAQDLHDDVGATLSTAKGYLSVLNRKEATLKLQQAQQILDEAADELRTISHQLMPKHFDQIGLAKAIEETLRKVSNDQLYFQFMCVGTPRKLSNEVETLIFKMVSELVRNVQKHAQATESTVQLIYHDTFFNLIVEDNGAGTSPYQTGAPSLRDLRTKAEYLNADLDISLNQYGTSVILTVPFKTQLPL
jgi:signal transduction histidine kinase